MTRRSRRITGLWTTAILAALSLTPAAWADTIWFKSGAAEPIATPNVTVARIESGNIVFTTGSGGERERKLDTVWKLKIDSEPALSEAEEAFTTGQWVAAATAYEKAYAAAKKDWVKDRAVAKMVIAAQQTKQFRLQATAYAMMAVRDPAAAGPMKPSIPADAKADLPAVISVVTRSIQTRPTDQLKAFQAQLYLANGDAAAASRVLAGGKTAEMIAAQAMVALKLNPPNYQQAMQLVEQNKALFTTPDTQLEALFALAEAKAGLAGNDPARRQDAAIAYIRVVAHFGNQRNGLIEESLMKAAALLEASGQLAEAAQLYRQVESEPAYRDSPTTRPAAAKAADLEKRAKAASAGR
jgi:hypothetical protein